MNRALLIPNIYSLFSVWLIFCTSFAHSQNLQQIKNNSNTDYLYIVGEIASLEGNPQKALDTFHQLKNIHPSIHLRLAQEYLNQGLHHQTEKLCQKIIEKHPHQTTSARLLLAQVYHSTQQLNLALIQYNKILQQDPSHSQAQFYKAVISTKLHPSMAQTFSTPFQNNTDFHQMLGDFYFSKNQPKKALQSFIKAFHLNPMNRYIAWRLFQIYHQQSQLQTFIDMIENTSPSDSYMISMLARAHLRQGHKEHVLSLIENLLWDDPTIFNLRAEWTTGLLF